MSIYDGLMYIPAGVRLGYTSKRRLLDEILEPKPAEEKVDIP